MAIKYKRILLKLSGEALAGEKGFGLDHCIIENICKSIKEIVELGCEVAIVVGGGNFWRGRTSEHMDRTRADHIGMLGTTMNALAVLDMLEYLGVQARVQTAITMQQIAEPYIRNTAIRHIKKGRVLVFGCGTGLPFFSTDTAAALRAAEIGADIIFKASLVDGVYDKDPKKNPDAKKFDVLTYDKMLIENLEVMDLTAAAMCKDNDIPILVFDLQQPENIVKAIVGENIGTIVQK